MAKYAEVKEKQRNVDQVREKDEPFNRGVWVGFTYKPRKVAQDEAEVRPKVLRPFHSMLIAYFAAPRK